MPARNRATYRGPRLRTFELELVLVAVRVPGPAARDGRVLTPLGTRAGLPKFLANTPSSLCDPKGGAIDGLVGCGFPPPGRRRRWVRHPRMRTPGGGSVQDHHTVMYLVTTLSLQLLISTVEWTRLENRAAPTTASSRPPPAARRSRLQCRPLALIFTSPACMVSTPGGERLQRTVLSTGLRTVRNAGIKPAWPRPTVTCAQPPCHLQLNVPEHHSLLHAPSAMAGTPVRQPAHNCISGRTLSRRRFGQLRKRPGGTPSSPAPAAPAPRVWRWDRLPHTINKGGGEPGAASLAGRGSAGTGESRGDDLAHR